MDSEASQGNAELPLVRRIQTHIRGQVRGGELPPGTKLPSMRQLSVSYGCSLGIVKQAINTLTAEGLLRSAPRRGVYVAPQEDAGRDVVVILPHLEIERLHVGLRGIRLGLADSGHRISLHAEEPGRGRDAIEIEPLCSPRVAGVLVLLPSVGEHDAMLDGLAARGVPTVVVDFAAVSQRVDVVAIDPVETGRMGAACLLERGHRSIALAHPKSDRRSPGGVLEGVRAACARAGAELKEIGVAREPRERGVPPWSTARDELAEALRQDRWITGVVGVGPQLALGASLAARAVGLTVPADLSVVGLLGDSTALQAADAPVTIVDNPLREVCETAARRLLDRVDGLSSPPKVLTVRPTLIERQSVAPPRSAGAAR
ncbi:MAG: GntR family transcriptional regulator [Planctomycetota bacterium]